MSEIKRNLAIVIGIDRYTQIPQLKNAVSDAVGVAGVLKEIYGYEVLLLLNQRATKLELDKLVANLQNKTIQFDHKPLQVDKSDRVLFYFAGHGFAEEAQESEVGKPAGYFMPQDAEANNKNTWLSMQQLYEAFSALDSHHLLMILDCCFAGRISWIGQGRNAVRSHKLYRQSYDRFIKHKTEQIITSAAHDEEARDLSRFGQRGEKNGNSPFAYLLLKVLQGNSDGGKDKSIEAIVEDKVITVHELFTYLQNKLGEVAEGQTPGLSQPRKYDLKTGEYVYLKGEYIFPLPKLNPEHLPKFQLNENTNPYKGLASFDTEDSDLFFGRTTLSQQLADVVKEQPLTIVLGVSGSGKSSLAKAGLIPTLTAKSNEQQWQILDPMRPGRSPFKELNKILTQSKSGSSIIRLSLPEKIEVLSKRFNNWAKRNLKAKLLLLIDQSEELLTLSRNRQERKEFLALLAELLNKYPQLRIVLTLRSDFESQIRGTIEEPNWQEAWQQGRFIVTPMNREELQQAIEEPAVQRTLFFESPKLVNQLIDEAIDRTGILPLLSFTLSELYVKYLQAEEKQERDDRIITEADYLDLGGVEGSLAQAAKRTYRELVKQKKIDPLIITNVMLRMISLNGSEITRRRVPKSELDYPESINEKVEIIINRFIAARLFTTGKDAEDKEYVEPVHDALVTRWQKLISKPETQENLLLQRRLTPAAEEWKRLSQRDKEQPKGILDKAAPVLDYLDRRLFIVENLVTRIPTQLFRLLRRAGNQPERLRQKPGQFLWNANPYLLVLDTELNSDDNWLNQLEAEFVQQSVFRKRSNIRWWWRGAGAVLLTISAAAVIAFLQWINAQKQLVSTIGSLTNNSEELFDSNKEFDALLASLNAGKNLKQVAFGANPDIERRIKGALQDAIFWVEERNRLEGHKGAVYSLSFSPDGLVMASSSADGTINLWNVDTGKVIKTLEENKFKVNVNSVSFSKNGLLASGSADGTVKLWNVTTGKVIKTLDKSKGGVNSVSFSPNGRLLAYRNAKNTIIIRDVTTGKTKPFKDHHLRMNMISFSPNGRLVAFVDEDGKTIKLWDIFTNKKPTTIPKEEGWGIIDSVSFSPNGQLLAYAGEDKTIHLWDIAKKEIIHNLTGHEDGVGSLSFNRNGQILASSSGTTIKIWDVATGQEIKTLTGYKLGISKISFSPNENLLASASDDGIIKLWDFAQGKEVIPLNDYDYEYSVGEGIAFSPDKKLLASTTRAGNSDPKNTIKLWDVATRKQIATLEGHTYWIREKSVSFSPDGKLLASADWTGKILLWDVRACTKAQSCKSSKTFSQKQGGYPYPWFTTVSFSPDGRLLASGNWNYGNPQKSHIQLWDVATGEDKTLTGDSDRLYEVSFSPDGKLLASASADKNIKLWDVPNRKFLKNLTGHSQGVRGVSFSRDGKLLASAGNDQTIKIWNVATGKAIKTLTGHTGSVSGVMFSPDGKWLVSGSEDKTIKRWDIATRKETHTFKGHRDVIVNFSLSHDGQLLASNSQTWGESKGEIILWDLKTLSSLNFNDLMEKGCDRVRDYLQNNPNVAESDRSLCDDIPSPEAANVEEETD